MTKSFERFEVPSNRPPQSILKPFCELVQQTVFLFSYYFEGEVIGLFFFGVSPLRLFTDVASGATSLRLEMFSGEALWRAHVTQGLCCTSHPTEGAFDVSALSV